LADIEGAIEDLQQALENDPDDLEAARELKLAERAKTAGSKSSSIFDAFRRR
jgi:hypothetical protein